MTMEACGGMLRCVVEMDKPGKGVLEDQGKLKEIQ